MKIYILRLCIAKLQVSTGSSQQGEEYAHTQLQRKQETAGEISNKVSTSQS